MIDFTSKQLERALNLGEKTGMLMLPIGVRSMLLDYPGFESFTRDGDFWAARCTDRVWRVVRVSAGELFAMTKGKVSGLSDGKIFEIIHMEC